MIKITLSRRLGELRVTQSELATVTGIRSNTINDLYHNVAERVNLEHLDMICEALDCNPNPIRTIETCRGHSVYKQKV